ncbi:hypothetical protein GJ689_24795 [Rhodoplanes serenus]|uniref:HNH nuclease domain-containing protein n=1 Tax=Rhodoplanes serenus TaxID=200615 RepID=A0A9X5AVT2_9BRAD|nr:hypothetical protein [Rhodoplanes serenus]
MDDRLSVPGFPSYLITRSGEIYRRGASTPLKAYPAKRGGYQQVSLWENGRGRTCFVHQLVALTFHGPRPSDRHHAAHRDGDKSNNTDVNVQWITKEENERDKVAHGSANIGTRNGGSVLSEDQVADIRRRAADLPRSSSGRRLKKGSLDVLSSEYGVTKSCLYQVISGMRWRHVQ